MEFESSLKYKTCGKKIKEAITIHQHSPSCGNYKIFYYMCRPCYNKNSEMSIRYNDET